MQRCGRTTSKPSMSCRLSLERSFRAEAQGRSMTREMLRVCESISIKSVAFTDDGILEVTRSHLGRIGTGSVQVDDTTKDVGKLGSTQLAQEALARPDCDRAAPRRPQRPEPTPLVQDGERYGTLATECCIRAPGVAMRTTARIQQEKPRSSSRSSHAARTALLPRFRRQTAL